MPAADRSLMTDIFMTRMFGFIFEQNSDNEKYRSEDAKELRETCVGIGRELDRTYIKLLGVNILASETRNKIDRGLVTLKENEKNAGQRYDGLFARLQDVENRVETNSRWMRAEISARIDVYSTPIIRRLDRAESISRNRLCTQGWQKIHRVYTWASDYLPPCFPLTIKDFRTLKEPDQFWNLAHLLRTYGVTESGWDDDDDDARKKYNQRLLATHKWTALEKAAFVHRDKVHRALALELGLDYDRILDAMNEMEQSTQPDDNESEDQESVNHNQEEDEESVDDTQEEEEEEEEEEEVQVPPT